MASKKEFVAFIVDQMASAGSITSRAMFGEYAIYCNGQIVALVCDNQLFIKPTEAGRAYIKEVVEAPPYPGAKPSFLIESKFEDQDWISHLVSITARELSALKPKKKKKKTAKRK